MATITISFDVTDAKQIELLEGFNGLAGKNINIHFKNVVNNYKIEPKGDTEGSVQFGKRCIKQIVEETIAAYTKNEDSERYRTEIEAIQPIQEITPDILT